MLLAKDDMKQTVLLHAALFGETGLVLEIWNWGREKLSEEEIKLFFLNKNDRRQTALNVQHSLAKQRCYRIYGSGVQRICRQTR